MSELLGLKFLLAGGQFLQVILPREKVQEIARGWMAGVLGQRSSILGDPNHPQGAWAVKVDALVGLHTFEVEQQPAGLLVSGVGAWNAPGGPTWGRAK